MDFAFVVVGFLHGLDFCRFFAEIFGEFLLFFFSFFLSVFNHLQRNDVALDFDTFIMLVGILQFGGKPVGFPFRAIGFFGALQMLNDGIFEVLRFDLIHFCDRPRHYEFVEEEEFLDGLASDFFQQNFQMQIADFSFNLSVNSLRHENDEHFACEVQQ